MVDQSQVVFSSKQSPNQPLDLARLKKLDVNQLRNDGPQKVLTFLEELKQGFDQGKPVFQINIPIVLGENTNLNLYQLYLSPPTSDIQASPPVLTLSHLVHLLDEIAVWTQNTAFPGNEAVKETFQDPAFQRSILYQQAVITEAWLSEKDQVDQLIRQVELLLELYQRLAIPVENQLASLDELIDYINQSDRESLLSLWNNPSADAIPLRELLTEFNELQTGKTLLEGEPNIPVHQVRLVANAYVDRLIKLLNGINNPLVTASISTQIKSLRNRSLNFSTEDPLAAKTITEATLISNYLQTIDAVVEALSKAEAVQFSLAPQTQPDQTDGPETEETAGEPSFQTPYIPAEDFKPQTLSDKNTYRYEAISIHAGFLYNHLTSNVFGLYPELPEDLRQLPPTIEYQLRQNIVRYLYELSPDELSQLNRYGRFALGEDLFRRLILRDPKVFISIERYIRAESQARNIQLADADPLKLEDRANNFQHEQFIREIPLITAELATPDAESSATEVQRATTPDVYNQTLVQSDTAFMASLRELGRVKPIELNQAITIRNLILSYIQTTGLDPRYVLANRNATELRYLFADVDLAENQVDAFIALVSGYWEYQLQKIQSITHRQITPDPLLVEKAATGNLTAEDINALASVNWDTAKSTVDVERRDPRLNIIASLTSTEDLKEASPQRQNLIQALNELYHNDQNLVSQSLQIIVDVQKAEREALAFEATQSFNHRQYLAFQKRVVETKTSGKEIGGAAVGLAAFNALSFDDKYQLINSLFADVDPSYDAPQDLYSDLLDSAEVDDFGQIPVDGETSAFGRIQNWFRGPRKTGQILNKGISRLQTLGSTSTQIRQRLTTKPGGTMISRAIGTGARAIFGDKVGGTIEKVATAFTSIGALVSALSSLISAGITLIGGGLFLLGNALLLGFPALLAGAVGLGAVVGGGIYHFFIRPILGGGTTAAAPTTLSAAAPPLTPGAPAVAPVSATPLAPATPPISIGAAATGIGLGGTALATVVMTMNTHGAFLTTLPTIGENDISPYVVIEKVATQGVKFDTPTDITYTIRIRARDGYQIQLTEAPVDTFSVTFAQREGENPGRTPTSDVPSSPEYDAFKTTLSTFHTDNSLITTEPITVGSYTIPFASSPEGVDYSDANVRNTFSIKFTVLDVNGQPVTELTGPTTASTGEVICFGECPQSKGGCWPTSGIVSQLPYSSFSHSTSDGIDIGATEGTPVYSPYEGEACVGNIGGGAIYGNHVIVEVDNAEYTDQSGGVQAGKMYLVFAHLHTIEENIANSCQQVTPGTQIGAVGNTGKSTGPHLHYEARWAGTNGGFSSARMMRPSLLAQLYPEEVSVKDAVRSCYDL